MVLEHYLPAPDLFVEAQPTDEGMRNIRRDKRLVVRFMLLRLLMGFI
jgi:hypothetical protein